jgi:hypothetical protein
MTLFFKPELLTDAEKISQKLKRPGKLAKYTAKGILKTSLVEGFLGTYGGYIATSDYNGELSFPRKHLGKTITVVITPQIVPIPLFENTILNLSRVPGVPASMYVCEQIYDEQKNQHYWQTNEITVLQDMNIPLAALVILAKPKNMRMHVGKTPVNETANFVLPDVYVKKGINNVENNLYMLTIRHLFKPVETEENREPLKIITQIID